MIKPKELVSKMWRPPPDDSSRSDFSRFERNERTTLYKEKEFNEIISTISSYDLVAYGELEPFYNKIIEWLEKDFNWSDVGVNYYRMETGVILPPHKDMYVQYSDMFNCTLDEIERVLLFMEDWKSGHYFEVDGNPIMDYKAGDYAWWKGKVEHAASNIGKDYRYTLQLTGHVK